MLTQGLEPLTSRLSRSDLTSDPFLPLSFFVDVEVFMDT